MNYRFEKNGEKFQIIEVRPWASFNVDLENEELVVFRVPMKSILKTYIVG